MIAGRPPSLTVADLMMPAGPAEKTLVGCVRLGLPLPCPLGLRDIANPIAAAAAWRALAWGVRCSNWFDELPVSFHPFPPLPPESFLPLPLPLPDAPPLEPAEEQDEAPGCTHGGMTKPADKLTSVAFRFEQNSSVGFQPQTRRPAPPPPRRTRGERDDRSSKRALSQNGYRRLRSALEVP